ncbi:hypothetical protein [Micromonospora sp. NPDC051006]|uniref:hypothetical protein n=1 Tax=Micromonospora sp. NPDC051006 TaxID=3364283 RepID=UPI0037B02A30
MTPHHLHATAAAWSLHTARLRLADLARDEAAQIAAEAMEAPSLLRSPIWGSRHAHGGHGDPTPGMVAVDDRPPRRNRWAEMVERVDAKLDWLACQLGDTVGFDPLSRVLTAIVRLQPGTVRLVAQHLADEDTWIRNAVGLAPARELLPGVDCPHCGERQLYVQTAGPIERWTVICATGRLCMGQGCPCGMPGAVEGVAHIWPRAAVLVPSKAKPEAA